MFVRQAHSFAQQARLAITLAWVAGCTNIVCVLSCGHVISHVSGTTSDVGRFAVDQKWEAAGFALYLLTTFATGAMLSGLATEFGRRKNWDSIYVLPMAIEMSLLGIFAFAVSRLDGAELPTGPALYGMTGMASLAMGLQNATITRISSGVVRTTHVTGVLTDFGLELTALLTWIAERKHVSALPWWKEARAHPAGRRVALLATIVGSFALGAAIGAILHRFDATRPWAMFPAVLFLAWIVYQDVTHPIAEIEPSELIKDAGLELPEGLLVYHLRRDTAQGGPHQAHHRMPNLLAWSERLPASARVIILDIDEVKELDEDAAFELRALLTNLRRNDKHLVIAGVTPEQFRQLQAAGTSDLLETNSVCADLELAIARGFNMLFQH